MNQGINKIKSFTDLDAWKEEHKLVLEIYKITKDFPKEEQFGLTNQLRGASISITSNIAEGFSRSTYKDKANFYSMALGSLTETKNQLVIARDVDYINSEKFSELANQTIKISKIINGLIKSSRSHNS
jgi:four helix bundle protein